jgi:hypothetical protein
MVPPSPRANNGRGKQEHAGSGGFACRIPRPRRGVGVAGIGIGMDPRFPIPLFALKRFRESRPFAMISAIIPARS